MLVLVQFIFVYNFVHSLLSEKKAEKNPWQASTLEWLAGSPPPHLNWGNTAPVVEHGPYEYAVEGEVDYLPQGKLEPAEVRG